MKYLKYLLTALVLLALTFVSIGVFKPAVSYDCEVMVNKPAKEAWAVMSDETRMSEWIKGYKRIELIKGEKNTVGAVSNVYVEENGQEMVMQETITKFQPNEAIGMQFSMDGFMDMNYEMSMEEVDGNTKIKTTSTTTGNGFFAKSMVALMGGSMKAQEDENLGNLKKVIEANTKNYFLEAQLEAVEEVEEAEY